VLKAKINCQPAPDVIWMKGGSDITKDSKFKITKDPNGFDMLTISSATRASAGDYEIIATNDMGKATSKCTIRVNSKLCLKTNINSISEVFTIKVRSIYFLRSIKYHLSL
jgi:hypothetical protein